MWRPGEGRGSWKRNRLGHLAKHPQLRSCTVPGGGHNKFTLLCCYMSSALFVQRGIETLGAHGVGDELIHTVPSVSLMH